MDFPLICLQEPSQLQTFLEVLNTSGCVNLKSIRRLVQWEKLLILNSNRYCELETLPSLKKLVSEAEKHRRLGVVGKASNSSC